MKKRILILGAACVLALSGCKGAKIPVAGLTKETDAKEIETEKETEPAWSEENESELYNGYIDIYNHMVGRLNDSVNRYFSYVQYQEEFALVDDRTDYDNYSISESDIEEIESAYSLLEGKTEKSELDEAFLQLYPYLTKLIGCLNDINSYTEMKSYLDDDYAKGKDQHSALWTDLNEYEPAAETFGNVLTEVEKSQQAESLQKLKDEGFDTLYAVNVMLYSVQAIQEELYNEGIYDENILDMDIAKIQPLYDDFIKNVDIVLELSQDEASLTEEGIPLHSAFWGTFLESMKKTKLSLTEVLQKVKEGTPLTEFDTVITIEGNCSLSSFDEGISNMIDDYNNFIQY